MDSSFNLANKLNKIKRCKPLLGTFVDVAIENDSSDLSLINFSKEVFSEILKIQKIMSFYDEQSELSYINNNAFKEKCKISPQMFEVLSFAIEVSKKTKGVFDITKSAIKSNKYNCDIESSYKNIILSKDVVFFNKQTAIDLGGIAKGYAVDCAFNKIANKVDNVIINAGGDMRMKNWQGSDVAIKYKSSDGKLNIVSTIMLNQAVASSANYYNKNAIIGDKKSNEDKAVSVFANSCIEADAFTKVVYLNGNLSCFDNLDVIVTNTYGKITHIN